MVPLRCTVNAASSPIKRPVNPAVHGLSPIAARLESSATHRKGVTNLKIDVRAELESFPWKRATWTPDKLTAASPFRYDGTPSFYVWLANNPVTGARAGDWGDYGATDPEYRRGGIVKLLAFLRNETEEETEEYLRWKYGEATGDAENLTLDLSGVLRLPERRQPLDPRILNAWDCEHPYLCLRGISPEVQKEMRVGYDIKRKAITIPWFLPDGSLGNVKFRRVDSKAFWYVKGGWPIRELVYGIDAIYRKRAKVAVLVEAEIDAMYVMTAGFPAVAVGGALFSEEKAEVIRRSPIERLLIATDNDEAGKKLREQVIEKMTGYCELLSVEFPETYKDVNEITDLDELRGYIERAAPVNWYKFPLLSQQVDKSRGTDSTKIC
ncbi:toprim domain-containing protein [Brevibacillus sp. SYP-B805]|uniref:toprim domain-containing protein n=1 Tax=Brevibacillus sp. SYP-B805 TaxID=1578199 RepID=UPI0013EB0571|nr:toprim domain-containing protein [Brevibacillus sp. SYP-B805]NGQ95450.1 toprim domain-containing protein [Brevibacillus sp. SYP-B805]